jgi:glycosyltransferase involved in cell wall biosynthesis
MTAAAARSNLIHLVNPLWDPNGGADLRTVDLYKLLGNERPVRLWSEYRVHEAFRPLNVERIRPWRYPDGGTIVLVGVYFRNGGWIHRTDARRIVVIYNTEQPDRLQKTLNRIGERPVQIVYTSEALRDAMRRDLRVFLRERRLLDEGVVLESFVEPSSFAAVFEKRSRIGCHRVADRFTVGRLSRDSPRKHHPSDPPFFSALAGRGMHVRVMGGTSLRERLSGDPHVELLPAGAVPSADFLSTLDAFYYRTHPAYFEAFGRVVLEAMLCGIPVVAESRGGYASYIRHGENGFLFDDPRDALAQLDALQADPNLRERIGRSAHATAERLFRDDLPLRTRNALLADSRAMEIGMAA